MVVKEILFGTKVIFWQRVEYKARELIFQLGFVFVGYPSYPEKMPHSGLGLLGPEWRRGRRPLMLCTDSSLPTLLIAHASGLPLFLCFVGIAAVLQFLTNSPTDPILILAIPFRLSLQIWNFIS